MNSRIRFGLMMALAILFGSTQGAGAAQASNNPSLVQIFDAVCVKPADAAGRKAAADAYGLGTPPEPFRSGPPVGDGDKLEFVVSKPVEERTLFLYALVGPIPGMEQRSGLTCIAALSPSDPAALSDVGPALGMSFAPDRRGSELVIFEETADGRRFLNVNDDSAIDAAMRHGQLSIIGLRRSDPKAGADAIYLLRTLGP